MDHHGCEISALAAVNCLQRFDEGLFILNSDSLNNEAQIFRNKAEKTKSNKECRPVIAINLCHCCIQLHRRWMCQKRRKYHMQYSKKYLYNPWATWQNKYFKLMGLQRTTWLASRVETLLFSDIMIYCEPWEEEDPGQIRSNKISFEAIFRTICFLYYRIALILPSYLTRLIEVFIGKHKNYLRMLF